MSETNKVFAPFTPAQVASLNGYQTEGYGPKFNCLQGNHKTHTKLVATEEGWVCEDATCSCTQNWAWVQMSENSWYSDAEVQQDIQRMIAEGSPREKQ